MKKTKEKIISAFALPSGQIVVLTNKGKLYCQAFIYNMDSSYTYNNYYSGYWTAKWVEIKNPIDNKGLLDDKKQIKNE